MSIGCSFLLEAPAAYWAWAPGNFRIKNYGVPLQVFNSHCAPEPVTNMQPEQLTVSELKGRLKGLNLPLNGRKVGKPSRDA